jgi:multidrug efflux pump subunit AcrA (membrane-fusion protein)
MIVAGRVRPWALTLALVSTALGCSGGHGVPTTREEAAAPTQRVTVARAPHDLSLLEAPARIVAAPGSEARVAASHDVRVVLVHVRAGDHVEAGAPVVDVVIPEVLAAAARLASLGPAQALRTARRTELAALQGEGLVDRGGVFEQEAELASLDVERRLALSTLRAASLTTAEAAQALRRGAITLRAPIAGTVREVNAVVGEVRAVGSAPFAVIAGSFAPRIRFFAVRARPWLKSLKADSSPMSCAAADSCASCDATVFRSSVVVRSLCSRSSFAARSLARSCVSLSIAVASGSRASSRASVTRSLSA